VVNYNSALTGFVSFMHTSYQLVIVVNNNELKNWRTEHVKRLNGGYNPFPADYILHTL
jgi:hypothetical protein